MLGQQQETIKIEVSLREPLLTPVINGPAKTVLRNPLTNKPMVIPFPVRSLDKTEALAEKFRTQGAIGLFENSRARRNGAAATRHRRGRNYFR